MKRLIYILAVVSLVVMASGCTSDPWASNKTFSSNGVTFTYPGTWSENASETTTHALGSSQIAGVGSDNEAFVITFVPGSGLSDSDLEDVKSQTIQKYKAEGFTTEKSIQVDGVSATAITNPTKDSSGGYWTMVVWVENGKIYIAAYGSKTSSDTQNMEIILSTLKTT